MKQGCVLAPVLFNIFFTCMLSHAVHGLEKGVYIRYCLDGSLFDLLVSLPKQRACRVLLQEVLFADDCALVAHTESDLQLMQDRFSSASRLFGLLHQPAPNTYPPAPNIVIDDTPLGNVDHFIYLGSSISCDGSLNKEIVARISKASQALGRLRNRVLNQHIVRLLIVYNAVVLPSLLYGCETWTLYRRHVKKLESFHMRALCYILGIKWQNRVTNLEVLDRRNQGRPKLRCKDTVKANLQWCYIKPKELEERAMDRPKWRALTHKAAANCEEARHQKLTAARDKRHRAASAVITTTDFQCPHCSRLCAFRQGLQSHLRIHR